jgi:hypothetical protein
MSGVSNEGIRTVPVVGAADIREYLLVSFNADGECAPFVKGSGAILEGSTDASSENGVVPVRLCNAEGTRYLKLDNSETIACAGWFTHGATAGTIAPVGADEPILGYVREGATSGATTFAVIECVLIDGLAAVADAIVNGDLPNFPVGPVVPLT